MEIATKPAGNLGGELKPEAHIDSLRGDYVRAENDLPGTRSKWVGLVARGRAYLGNHDL